MRDFGIVIPHLDYSDRLATCLWSVIAQEGSTTVHCHIQDGGKTNSAEIVVDEIRNKADSARFLITYSRAPDLNAADAINKGMATVNAEMVTWLGADDFLMPGALETVFSLRTQHPQIRWVTGLPHIVNEQGVGIPTYGSAGFYRHSAGFSREALQRGLFAGELNHGWIQQEGTFWQKSLWDEVGGLDQSLRLAFDFDLWCRMAEHSELVEVVAPLGAFRKRAGQASSNMRGYLEEAAEIRSRAGNLASRPRKRVASEVTWIAYHGKHSSEWKLDRGKILIWFRRSFSPALSSAFFRGWKSRTIRSLRKLAQTRLFVRMLVFSVSKIRRFFHLG